MDIFMEEMRNLFIGQSFDLYWTRFGECPSQEEYLEMVNRIYRNRWRLPLNNPSHGPKSTAKEEGLFPRCAGQLSRKVLPDPR